MIEIVLDYFFSFVRYALKGTYFIGIILNLKVTFNYKINEIQPYISLLQQHLLSSRALYNIHF